MCDTWCILNYFYGLKNPLIFNWQILPILEFLFPFIVATRPIFSTGSSLVFMDFNENMSFKASTT
jgi:hypothetical protein